MTKLNITEDKIGTTYRTRSGDAFQFTRYTPESDYPVKGQHSNSGFEEYTTKGTYFSNHRESGYDLISEVKDAPVSESSLRITAQDVGVQFVRRDNEIVTITEFGHVNSEYPVTATDSDGERSTYTANGFYYDDDKEDRDLVRRLVEPQVNPALVTETTLWDRVYADAIETLVYSTGATTISDEMAESIVRSAKRLADLAVVHKDN